LPNLAGKAAAGLGSAANSSIAVSSAPADGISSAHSSGTITWQVAQEQAPRNRPECRAARFSSPLPSKTSRRLIGGLVGAVVQAR
jgi:hypothetical protein